MPEVIPAWGYLVKYIYYYLTPCIPLSFKGEGKRFLERGASPLLNSPLIFIHQAEEGERRL
jgi:hypothetical protein